MQIKCDLTPAPTWGLALLHETHEVIVSGGAGCGSSAAGVAGLAQDLGVNHKTVEAALSLLERDGLLAGQGPRGRKRIVA